MAFDSNKDYLSPASHGARGSFSHVDPSKYGQRGLRSTHEVIGKFYYTGYDSPLIPGAGGGARPTALRKYGSRAPGYSPDGIVVIRVFKINP